MHHIQGEMNAINAPQAGISGGNSPRPPPGVCHARSRINVHNNSNTYLLRPIFSLRRGDLISRSCRSVRLSVGPQFSNFSKKDVSRVI